MSEKMRNCGVIVQARAMSGRLPEKIFLPLGNYGKTVLEAVVDRLLIAFPKEKIIIATTVHPSDDRTAALCKNHGILCERGHEHDVLDRYYQVAKKWNLSSILRVGADSPVLDPFVIKEMVDVYVSGDWDYVSNTLEDTYPEGLNAEIFSFEALQKAWGNAKRPSEREHVTPYIKTGDFRKYSFLSPSPLPQERWTLDYPKDYELLKAIYEGVERADSPFTTQDILNFLKKNPQWQGYNKDIPRNEGYQKSVQAETQI